MLISVDVSGVFTGGGACASPPLKVNKNFKGKFSESRSHISVRQLVCNLQFESGQQF